VKYTSTTKQEGNVVTFSRTATTTGLLYGSEHYPALRRFYSSITTADQQPLVFEPAGAAK
nr:hypothetical protein [Acidobacteriota bacterium]